MLAHDLIVEAEKRSIKPAGGLHLRRDPVEINENMKTGVNAIFDKSVELIRIFHLGELLHDEILLFGGHVFASEVKRAPGSVWRQAAFAPYLE